MRSKKHSPHSQEDYQLLAEKVRKAALTASTETERADLLATAKRWDFLADHQGERHRGSTP